MKNLESIINNTETSEFLVKKPLEIYESYEVFCQENNLTPVSPRELKKAILSLHDLEVRPFNVNGKATRVYYNSDIRKTVELNPVVECVESLEGELWTDVKGYDGIYKISTHGRLKRILKSGERLQGGRINNNEYLIYTLSKGEVQECTTAQQLVAQAFIPNPLKLPQVDHFDHDKLNNHVSNLSWVDEVENKKRSKEFRQFDKGESENFTQWLGDDICP